MDEVQNDNHENQLPLIPEQGVPENNPANQPVEPPPVAPEEPGDSKNNPQQKHAGLPGSESNDAE